ncbi:MAG: sugar transferase [Thermodesulfobacteriota bacterium]|nr:sugar transferase [Thermodesulfobacteriota bacterium]
MIQQQVSVLNNILMLLDALCVIIAGYWSYSIMIYLLDSTWTIELIPFITTVWVMMCLNNYFMGKFGLYGDRREKSNVVYILSISKAVGFSGIMVMAGIFLTIPYDFPREFLLIFISLSFVLISGQRMFMRTYIEQASQKSVNARKILIVGSLTRGRIVAQLLEKQLSWGHEVIGRLAVDSERIGQEETIGMLAELPEILRLQSVDEVVFAVERGGDVDMSSHLKTCREMGIPARILPALWKAGEKSISTERCQGVPFLTMRVNSFSATGLLYKRLMDVVAGTVGTLIFCVMYPFIGLAIKLESPGPVLFKQKRIGLHGRPFILYKFRSMYENAEFLQMELMAQNEMNGAIFKLENDPRITPIGGWLRKTSLDEFPQFLNVLKGEMSLVGTRPPLESEVNEYQTWHLRRISIKPGITGLWQVSGRNEIKDFDKIVELDCSYLDNWRFINDLKILLKTIGVVLKRKGAK